MTAAELAAIVREHTERAVTAALAPVLAENKALELRILELETRPAVLGPQGEKGADGLPGVGIASLLLSAEGRLMAHMSDGRTLDAGPVPRGVDGAPGAKGDTGPPGTTGQHGKDGLPGERGERGEKGLDGLQGPPGTAGERGEKGLDGLMGPIGPSGERGEKGLDGLQGSPGEPGHDGLDGKDGASGLNGKDGIGVMDAVLDRAGHLLLTLSDGRTKDVGLVTGSEGLAGKDGAPGLNGNDGLNGKDGADGMTLDDAELVCDDAGWQLRLTAGGRTKDCPLPLWFDAGAWTAGKAYPAGAGASWDGGYWIAKALTSDQPGTSDAWRLAVRRGKQGKEGKSGRDGRDLTPSNTPPLY